MLYLAVCQAYDSYLAPGGSERRRLSSLVVPLLAVKDVEKQLQSQGAQVRHGNPLPPADAIDPNSRSGHC